MPYERIFGTPGTEFLTKVTWYPDQDVQVSTELHSTDPATGILTQVMQGQHAEDIGRDFKAWMATDAAWKNVASMSDREVGEEIIRRVEAGRVFTEVAAHLDRSQCNRLISVLRRARNSAYGADE